MDVGIAGDERHQKTGGYHIGRSGLAAIGRYHPQAHAGDPNEDYSARTARDRRGLDENASAMDVGDNWPRGGRPAWIRFNNLLVAALRANDPALSAVRGVNYTPDGATKLRTDREQHWAVSGSSDSVDMHTHIEFYRDTEGHRDGVFARLVALIGQAINGGKATDMDLTDTFQTPSGETKTVKNFLGDVYDVAMNGKGPFAARVEQQLSTVAAGNVDLNALAAALAPLLPKPPSAADIAAELAKRLGNG